MSSTRNTYTSRKVAVTTTKKSHASVSGAWFRTNVRHVCMDERGRDGPGTPDEERRIREAALDETVTGSFPVSDPASSLPNPDEHDAEGNA
jgi:hypothetical protein